MDLQATGVAEDRPRPAGRWHRGRRGAARSALLVAVLTLALVAACARNAPPLTAAQWAASWGTFDPVTLSGTGRQTVAVPSAARSGILTARHDGAGALALVARYADDQLHGDVLTLPAGTPSGTRTYGLTFTGTVSSLRVVTEGTWTVTLAPVSTAPAFPGSGHGTGAYLYDGRAERLTVTHDGRQDVIVTEASGRADRVSITVLLVSRTGGTAEVTSGPAVIDVQADGAWTATSG